MGRRRRRPSPSRSSAPLHGTKGRRATASAVGPTVVRPRRSAAVVVTATWSPWAPQSLRPCRSYSAPVIGPFRHAGSAAEVSALRVAVSLHRRARHHQKDLPHVLIPGECSLPIHMTPSPAVLLHMYRERRGARCGASTECVRLAASARGTLAGNSQSGGEGAVTAPFRDAGHWAEETLSPPSATESLWCSHEPRRAARRRLYRCQWSPALDELKTGRVVRWVMGFDQSYNDARKCLVRQFTCLN